MSKNQELDKTLGILQTGGSLPGGGPSHSKSQVAKRKLLTEEERKEHIKYKEEVGLKPAGRLVPRKSDSQVREQINEIANKLEAVDDPLMNSLVSPEMHKDIVKRQMKRRAMRKESEHIKANSMRQTVKDFKKFQKELQQDATRTNKQKEMELNNFRNLLLNRHRGRTQEARDMDQELMEKNLGKEFEA